MRRFVLLILCCFITHAFAANEVINVYNWSGYLPEKVLRMFTEQTGIKVNYSTFDSDEDLYTKLKAAPNSGYDLVFPSTSYVHHMIHENMIQELDKTKIIGMQYLNPRLLNQDYDPHNQYSLPYLWGTTGIFINRKYYAARDVNKWQDFWKTQFKGQLSLVNDMRDIFAIALKVLGYSINDQNPDHIKQAYLLLKKLLPNVQSFAGDGSEHLYINENSNIGMIESGDAQMVIQENANFYYIYPKDGAIIWIDCMVIPKNAKHVNNAYKFINFVLQPKIAKMISEGVGFSTPNAAAIKMMRKSVQNNRVLNPTKADLLRGEIEDAISQNTRKLYLRYWELLKLGD